MSTADIVANTNDGSIRSRDTTYLTARSGGTFAVSSAASQETVGQDFNTPNYDCYEMFLSFDTTGITNVESAVLSMCCQTDTSTTDFTIQARAYSWSASNLTSADWLPGASAQTLLATLSTAGIATGTTYNTFASQDRFASAINPSGVTDIVLTSDRMVAATVPSGAEFVALTSANGGAAVWPILTVVYDVRKIQVVTSSMRW